MNPLLKSALLNLAVPFIDTVTSEIRASIISMHRQEFKKGPNGCLQHFTDGNLRCEVPPESWNEYCEQWPEAIPVVNYLRRGSPTLKAPKKKKAKKQKT